VNEDRVIGRWHQWVGQAKESWGLLTHDGAVAHAGRRERLSGVIRQRYGVARDEAARAIAARVKAPPPGLRPPHRRASQAGRIEP
jgi:uncharacterized protein YjbJ (UPF0337 family)